MFAGSAIGARGMAGSRSRRFNCGEVRLGEVRLGEVRFGILYKNR